jgi:hypothetical protein
MSQRLEKALAIGIAISAVLMAVSMLEWLSFGIGSTTPQTPTGQIQEVTQTQDGKVLITFGAVVPWTRYQECAVIVAAPAYGGGFSDRRLWKIAESPTGFVYNSTISLAIDPADVHEYVGTNGPTGVPNDTVAINCSAAGLVPTGPWLFFLVDLPTTYPIISMTFTSVLHPQLNGTALSFGYLGKQDPMGEFGFIYRVSPQGVWLLIFYVSTAAFVTQCVALAYLLARRRK